jgi:hypothetical protein
MRAMRTDTVNSKGSKVRPAFLLSFVFHSSISLITHQDHNGNHDRNHHHHENDDHPHENNMTATTTNRGHKR